MGYDNQPPGQQAQSNEPFFPVSKAVVFEGDARPGKHLICILEAKAMLGEVLPVLGVVPFVLHSRSTTVTLCVVTHKAGSSLTLTEITGGAPLLTLFEKTCWLGTSIPPRA